MEIPTYPDEPSVNRADTMDLTTPTPEPERTPIVTVASPPQDPPVSLCRMVIFHMAVGDHVEDFAAKVVAAWSPTCATLRVYSHDGTATFPVSSCSKADQYGQAGRWSYPPRVA